MDTNNSWTEFFQLVIEWLFSGDIPNQYKKIKPHERKVWICLIIITIILMIIPILGLLISIIFQKTWIVSLFGIMVIFLISIITFRPLYIGFAAMIGVIRGALYEKKDIDDEAVKIGKKYIDFIFAIILWELITIAFVAVFPVHKNLTAIPTIAFSTILLGIMIYVWQLELSWFRKFAFNFMIIVLIISVITIIFPESSKIIAEKLPKIDPAIAKILKNDLLNFEKTEKKNETPPPTVQRPPRKLKRIVTKTFILPAGRGPEETKVSINRGQRFWVASDKEVYLMDGASGRKIKIGPKGWTSPPTKKEGNLTFFKKSKTIRIDYYIF